MTAESTYGIVIAKAEPEPGGFCVVVLSGGRLLSPFPDEGLTMFWTSDEVREVTVGCELEIITTGCATSSELLPHSNNDVPCVEMRRVARNRMNATSLCKALASVVTRSIDDAWPSEFMSRGSHRHLLPGMDVPSIVVLRGSIACIYEVSQHFAAFNSQHRADLQLTDRGFGAIPVICGDLQASPSIASGEGHLILSVSRPEHQGDGAYSEQELCAVLLLGFLPFRSELESDHSAITSLNTSSGSELRSDMSTLASSSEVRCGEDTLSAPGNWYSAPAQAYGNWNLAPGDWNAAKAVDNDFYVGWVVVLREKYCMVECPESGYQTLVYIHRTTASPRELQKGDAVTFRIHENRKGQPQASPPLWKLVDTDATGGRDFGKYTGQIRRIGLNGMGVVDCEEVGNNEAVWIGKDCVALGLLCVGDTISFNLERDASETAWVSKHFWKRIAGDHSQRDDDQADNASVMSGNMAALAYGTPVKTAIATVTRFQQGDYHPSMPSKGSGKKGKLGNQGEAADAGFLTGRVMRSEQKTGFTFVQCPDSQFDRDVCVDRAIAERGGLQVNDIVCFKVRVNNFGLPQAQSPVWKFLGEAAGATRLPRLGKYTGRVSMALWNGSGLVECPEVFALCGEHAYLLAADMQAGKMDVGDTVSFELNYSSEGRPLVARGFWKSCSRCSGLKEATHAEAEQEENRPRRMRQQDLGGKDDWNLSGDWSGWSDGMDAWAHASREDGHGRPPLRRPLQHRLREEVWEPAWEPEPGGWTSSLRDAQWGHASSSSKGNLAWSGKGGFSLSSKGGSAWSGKSGDNWSGKVGDPWSVKGEAWYGKGADARSGKAGDPWAGKNADTRFAKASAARAGKAGDAASGKSAGMVWQMKSGGSRPGKSAGAWPGSTADTRSGKARGKGNSSREDIGGEAWSAVEWATSRQREEDIEEEGWADVHRGEVTMVNVREGYCMADFAPDYKEPVYISSNVADPVLLSLHDSVACVASPNSDGALEAYPPVWKLMGGRGLKKGDYSRWFGDHKGTVSFYKDSGAFGFVKSYSVRDKYGGKDAYIHQTVMERCGLDVGDKIVFNVHISSNGNPQVSAPLWKCISL